MSGSEVRSPGFSRQSFSASATRIYVLRILLAFIVLTWLVAEPMRHWIIFGGW
ncbi:MAG: hypothetical protein WCV00_01960 [Verrucomicrobiia bacterium]